MNKHRYVISGLGLAIPAGVDLDTIWRTLAEGQPLFQPHEEFSRILVASIGEEQLDHGLNQRQLKKLDRFTVLSAVATKAALEDSSFPLVKENQDSLGILLGNCTGGWSYVEPMMYPLYTEGMQAINPYVATAWFPAAPQGELSIYHGIGGYSKTLAGDRLSAGLALEQSLWLLESEVAGAFLVGGAESPLSSLVINAFLSEEELSTRQQYQPFTDQADGHLLGEGAGIVLVENYERAQQREANLYAEVVGIGRAMSLETAIKRCLETANLSADRIDYVLLDGAGNLTADQEEYRCLGAVFGDNSRILLSAPKSLYGNLLGANMAVDIALACLSFQKQTVLPTYSLTGIVLPPPCGCHVVGKAISHPLEYILINGRDREGQSLAIVLKRL
ncbi:MAG: hypothetical protein IM473_14580 [Microcystis sp. M015S2]|jgi:3-oxoacyl-(acyl-carrier-protein) synthase|uniref:beta-ketoacyl-[acyl-carrier-protein] synthase family protein n=1 Tax=unclassified Microcystis TaxID=2643300 RepID=UPI0022C13C90|nr:MULTISPECIES: beta-ketoacyl synthase N-terminal-like domain-containing protein [unclassified Microcystis]MCZ8306438.1 beta-ketoacyl synthase N-terminal-like domain-containing protein [Microcystis sp. LE19-98.1E]MCA2693149.1 hypothetical protein [Microcystis sp. M034S2]MCA2711291.1 hypothetical protein [Microcystis sp. M025S2]MCA2743588.1 hypothetical protein [Microcystis sp. M015S2]MCA2751402.1 hypothetical protein [Microcystis sp. M144S2]